MEESIIQEKTEGVVESYISPQRKAFIDWIRTVFYPTISKNVSSSELKVYQLFIKAYLSLNTPYRGVLVYHGLGTGKTATAISTAEGLSKNMPITTMLPASLETEFIKEVKRWGDSYFQMDQNNWIFKTDSEIKKDTNLRKQIFDKFKLTLDSLSVITNKVKRKTKNRSIPNGMWLISRSPQSNLSEIKTVTGTLRGENENERVTQLTEDEKIHIDEQIIYMIYQKYNFIHYNPFPKVDTTSLDGFKKNKDEVIQVEFLEPKEYNTRNKQIVKNLEDKLRKNKSEHFLNSPFRDEVLIIDEVHNFTREIFNNSGPSRTFYEWIKRGENIKIVFLSGTPIINRPAEIAILFNMLKGIQKTYSFILKTDKSTLELQQNLKNVFYKKGSPIDQFLIKEQRGRKIISFLKNDRTFESILDKDSNTVYTIQKNNHSFDDFINAIYEGLTSQIKMDEILPNKTTLLQEDLGNIQLGKPIYFDEDKFVLFNRFHDLFEVFDDENQVIDLTNNDNFMDYFFDSDGNDIPEENRILLKRMLQGLTSYYPIDRQSIVDMPEVVKPQSTDLYKDYLISGDIQVELCPMSEFQFEKYSVVWKEEMKNH